jgi:urease accessory protein
MLIAGRRIAAGAGLAPVLLRRAATVALDWDTRQKSRFDTVDSDGRAFGVVLPRGTVLRGGDVLVVEDGSLVRVEARPQAVLRVTPSEGSEPATLVRAAYHLGNRHVPLEVRGDHLQLEPDHVLQEMLMRMGFVVEAATAPFEPESGAYGGAAAASPNGRAHVHGPGCGHDHA